MHRLTRHPLACGCAAVVLVTGCLPLPRPATPPQATVDVARHALFVHPDGRARAVLPRPTARRVVGAPLDQANGERHLATLLQAVRESPHDTILLYVHGGRIPYTESAARTRIRGAILDSAGYHAIFVNWNSAGLSSLAWHLFRMRQGQDWGPWRGLLSAPFVFAGAVGRTVSRAPLTTLQQAADYCRTLGGVARGDLEGPLRDSRFCPVPGVDQVRREQAAYEHARRNGTADAAPRAEPTLAIGLGTHDHGWTVGTTRVLTGVTTLAPKLVLAPVADGFGAGALSEMRRRATSMIHAPDDVGNGREIRTSYQPPQGIVHALVDSLQALLQEYQQPLDDGPARTRTLILVGHSLGTLVLDQILEHFPRLEVARIIYLAPASTVTDLERGVVRYLERHPRTLYYHGMLHPYADAGEWQPGMLDLVPRGSLLEWMDDYLTSPDTPLDRVSGKWSNIVVATHVFSPSVRSRVVLKAFGVRDPFDADDPALHRGLHRHGGFSNPAFAFWDERSWRLRPHRTPDGRTLAPLPPGARAASGQDGH